MAQPRELRSRILQLAGATSGTLSLVVPATVTSYTLTLPATAPAADGYVLQGNMDGTTSWGVGGGGSSAWSALTDPSANLTLTMGAYRSAFTYNAATGTNNLWTLGDSSGNTGTGALLQLTTATGSAAKALGVTIRGNNALQVGFNTTQSYPSLLVGATTATFANTYGIISFGGSGNDRSFAILLNDSVNYRSGLGFASNELRVFNTYTSGFKVSLGGITSGTSTYNEIAYVEQGASGFFAVNGARGLRLYDSDNSAYAAIKPNSVTTSYTIELPAATPSGANSIMSFTTAGVASFTNTPQLSKLSLNTSTFGTSARLQVNAPTSTINDALVVVAPPNTSTSGLTLQWAGTPVASPPIFSIQRSDGSLWLGLIKGTGGDRPGIRFGSATSAPVLEGDSGEFFLKTAIGGNAQLQTGTLISLGDVTINGIVTGKRPLTVATTDQSPSGNQNNLNMLYTNEGATGEVRILLPTAVAGARYGGYVQTAQYLKFQANLGDTIRLIDGSTSLSAGYVRSNTVGAFIELTAVNATEWIALAQNGTWTVDS